MSDTDKIEMGNVKALKAENERLREIIRSVHSELGEIVPGDMRRLASFDHVQFSRSALKEALKGGE